jgi:iron-sulfur cluster assembly protein
MENTEITLTDRAADHVKRYLAKLGTDSGLRIGVKPTGCSGYQYTVQPVENTVSTDKTFSSQGIRIVIDSNSLPYLEGTELDYVKEGLNAGFRFNNPNVEQTCGCGESFTVKQADH